MPANPDVDPDPADCDEEFDDDLFEDEDKSERYDPTPESRSENREITKASDGAKANNGAEIGSGLSIQSANGWAESQADSSPYGLKYVHSSPSLLEFRNRTSTQGEEAEPAEASANGVKVKASPKDSNGTNHANKSSKAPKKRFSLHLPLPTRHKASLGQQDNVSSQKHNGHNVHKPTNNKHPNHNGAKPFGPDSRRLSLPILSRLRVTKKPHDAKRPVSYDSQVVIVTSVQDSPPPPEGPKSTASRRKRFSFLRGSSQGGSGGSGGCCGGFRFPFPIPERLRRWFTADSSLEHREIRNTLAIGVAFQLVFTANFAIQNLQSSLHEEESMGASALGCMYATSIFSSIFAPTIIGILGAKGCLVVAWICHILYTLAQFYPAWGTLVPASILLGLLTGPTWTAQGLYVSACAFSFSKRSQHSPYTILSRFNGLFFALYETKNILGNLVSSFVLRNGVGNKSEGIIFKFCGPDDCPDAENVTDIEEPDTWVVDTMLGIYMALQVLALILTVVLVTPLARSEWVGRVSLRETATSWFHTLVGTEMIYLVPFMVFQSMEQGILLTEYTRSYISCPIGIHKVGFVMASYGAVTAFFVLVFSRLARLTGRYPLFALAASVNAALLAVLLNWIPERSEEELIFIFPAVWGVSEGIWQTQTNSMLAVIFYDRKEPAFANYQTWRAVGYTLIFSYHSFLCVSTKLAIALGFLVVGMILYTAVEIRIRWKERIRIPKSGQKDPSAKRKSTSQSQEGLSESVTDVDEVSGNSSDRKDERGSGVISLLTVPGDDESTGKRSRPNSGYSFSMDDDLGSRSEVTLDGTYLSRGENAFLDNDLKKYGVAPLHVTRPLRVSQFARSASEDAARWSRLSPPDSPNLQEQHQIRPHSWHDRHFHNAGDLKIVWEKDDVYVF